MLTALQLSQLTLRLVDDDNKDTDLAPNRARKHRTARAIWSFIYIYIYFFLRPTQLPTKHTRSIIAIDAFNIADEYWIRVRHD